MTNMMWCHFLVVVVVVVVVALATTPTTLAYDEYSHLVLDCLTHGSNSKTDCVAIPDCVWCPASSSNNDSKKGVCVSAHASTSLDKTSPYQCFTSSTTDDTTTTTDDDASPAPDHDDDDDDDDDDYFPSADDNATFDDDAAVDDDKAIPTTDDDKTPTTDDDARNDDVDTDDYNPYTDDQATTDDQANTDDDNTDEYMKKLLECLAVGNVTACESHGPTSCVWCTTHFGEGLCMSDEAGHDIDGSFYTCQWNTTLVTVQDEVDSSVYDHYCWNAPNEEACENEVDGRDVPCEWCEAQAMCFSKAQTDLLDSCTVKREE